MRQMNALLKAKREKCSFCRLKICEFSYFIPSDARFELIFKSFFISVGEWKALCIFYERREGTLRQMKGDFLFYVLASFFLSPLRLQINAKSHFYLQFSLPINFFFSSR